MKSFTKIGIAGGVLLASLAAASPASALTNLALGQATSASSQAFGAASNAVDGSTSTATFFQSGTTPGGAPEANPFWIVDLGGTYSLNDVYIYTRGPDADGGARLLHDWTLTLFSGGTLNSPTGVVSSNVYNVGDSSPGSFDVTNGITGSTARFVEISLNRTSANPDYLALAEVQVFGSAVAQTAVPEPASMLLLAMGLGGVALTRRKVSAARSV